MSDLLWFNGIDAADLGFVVEEAPDLLSEGARSPQTVEVPQGQGAILASVPASVAPRVLRLSGFVTADTLAAATVILDRVKAAVGEGLVEIRSAWATDRIVRGVLVAHSAGPEARAWLGRLSVTLEFLCTDPYAYLIEPSVISFTSTATEIPLGSAPSRGRDGWSAIITIAGAATTPTLTECDAAGNALRTMVFTNSPGANDAIEIDVGRGLVTAIASGTRSNGYGNLAAGFEFPKLDPADGDWYTSAFPMLKVSSGTASVTYHKAYR